MRATACLAVAALAVLLAGPPQNARMSSAPIMERPTDGAGDPDGNGYDAAGLADLQSHVVAGIPVTIHFTDAPGNEDASTLAWVDKVEGVARFVWNSQRDEQRFRAPIGDGALGGDSNLDIYLTDLAGDSYGYCLSDDPDDPNVSPDSTYEHENFSVYCVLDNDYAQDDYCPCPPDVYGLKALKVTFAHEFFHAVHCAYDCYEPGWVREGTAVWQEDRTYDAINSNYWYLKHSALVAPKVSLHAFDTASDPGGLKNFEYGAWLFWRFLEEDLGPGVVKGVWERIRDDATGADMSPIAAIGQVSTARRGRSFAAEFARFGARNYYYERFYSEGPAYRTHLLGTALPARPPSTVHKISERVRSLDWKTTGLNPLSNAYVSFVPGAGTAGARLQVKVDLPAPSTGARATLIVRTTGGATTFRTFSLNGSGVGTRTASFDRRTIARVVLVLTAAGTGEQGSFRYRAALTSS